MKIRQSIFLLTALMMIALLVGCSSSGTKTPPPPPAISVTFSPSAPGSVLVNSQTPLTAVVQNDSANGGVNWIVSCTAGPSARPGTTIPPCGSLSATSTASGTANTYTAPPAVPASAVTITATSVTDGTKAAVANITIATAVAPPLADGNYVFSVFGNDAASGRFPPYSVAGVFTVGGGVITGGEQDFVNAGAVLSDLINGTGSSVSTTADGNLQVVLTTCNVADCSSTDGSLGVNGVETFSGALTCTCKALITEFDGSATGSGTLDLQTTNAIPTGGYAFAISGSVPNASNPSLIDPLVVGGIINVDNVSFPGSISGAGSVLDVNDAGLVTEAEGVSNTSSVSAPDASGRVVFTLDSPDFQEIVLVGYVIDATRIRLVETNDNFVGTTGGSAFGQGVNTGQFSSAAFAGQSYVLGLNGYDINFILQAAGVVTANQDGTVSGNVSYNDLGLVLASQSPLIPVGTYTVDPSGRVTMTGVTDNVVAFNLQLYLTGDGHAVAISMDNNDALAGLGFAQTGPLVAASFGGTYVMDVTGADQVGLFELDAVGPVTADGVGTFTGTADLNWLLNSGPVSDLSVSGTFGTPDSNGSFTGTITGLDVTFNSSDAFTYYLADPTTVVGIETDNTLNQLTLAYFSLELE